MFDLIYKNVSASSLGLKIDKRPSFPAAERDVEFIEIPGRSGSLVVDSGTYKDIEVDILFNFVNPDDTEISRVFRDAKKWLSASGGGRLYVSDDTDVFYKVKHVKISDSDRTARIGHKFTATFRLDPFTYLRAGDVPLSLPATLYNPGETAEPVYSIAGDGVCIITLDGVEAVRVNVSGNITIDVPNRIAYRTDTGERSNAAVTGYLKALEIPPGLTAVTLTTGFSGVLVPGWRSV